MFKIFPLIMSAIALFSAGGAIPLKDPVNGILLGGGAIPYEQIESYESVKPMIKQPRTVGDVNFAVEGETARNLTETESNTNDSTVIDNNGSVKENNGSVTTEIDANAIFELRKNELNERYAKMFELKNRLDEMNKESESLWQEYYAMRESYDRAYKRLVREWANNKR